MGVGRHAPWRVSWESSTVRTQTDPSTNLQPPAASVPREGAKLDWILRLGAGLILTAAALALVMLSSRHPSGWVPECPTHAYLGVVCPGCGSTRATHFLLNFRVMDAIAHNPLLVFVGVPLGVWYAVELVSVVARGRRLRPLIRSPRVEWVAWIALGVVVGFGVVRNLPGAPFDRLRPPPAAPSALDSAVRAAEMMQARPHPHE